MTGPPGLGGEILDRAPDAGARGSGELPGKAREDGTLRDGFEQDQPGSSPASSDQAIAALRAMSARSALAAVGGPYDLACAVCRVDQDGRFCRQCPR
jgi:hypothetical protein